MLNFAAAGRKVKLLENNGRHLSASTWPMIRQRRCRRRNGEEGETYKCLSLQNGWKCNKSEACTHSCNFEDGRSKVQEYRLQQLAAAEGTSLHFPPALSSEPAGQCYSSANLKWKSGIMTWLGAMNVQRAGISKSKAVAGSILGLQGVSLNFVSRVKEKKDWISTPQPASGGSTLISVAQRAVRATVWRRLWHTSWRWHAGEKPARRRTRKRTKEEEEEEKTRIFGLNLETLT